MLLLLLLLLPQADAEEKINFGVPFLPVVYAESYGYI
jgi:hypothetical protein